MLSKPCGELYCHALAYCDMCGRLPFSTEYKLKVSRPQGAGAALCVLCGPDNHPLSVEFSTFFLTGSLILCLHLHHYDVPLPLSQYYVNKETGQCKLF